jgi:hypothetical protein
MVIDIDWFIHYNSVGLLVINILRDWVTVSNRNHYNINVSNPKPFKSHLGKGGGRAVVGCS